MTTNHYGLDEDDFNLIESIQVDLYEYENRIQFLEDQLGMVMSMLRAITSRRLQDKFIVVDSGAVGTQPSETEN
jgi:hypothetical protein